MMKGKANGTQICTDKNRWKKQKGNIQSIKLRTPNKECRSKDETGRL